MFSSKLSKFLLSLTLILIICSSTFSQVFTEHLISSAPGSLTEIRIGDLNGDGYLDIVAADRSNDDIFWFKNDGNANPTFTTIQLTPNAGDVATMRIVDIDGDGKNDVLSSSNGHNNITWYRNNGGLNPTFQKKSIVTPFNFSWGSDAGDLDGDGIKDVAGAARDADEVWWWKNSGGANPTWSGKKIESSLNGAYNVVIADINGDTDLDIAVTSKFADHVVWYENSGGSNPSFTKHTIDTSTDNPNDLVASDIDGDGDIDLFVARNLNDVTYFINDGNDPPVFTKNALSLNGVSSVAAADFDGDMHIDLIGSGTSHTVRRFINDGIQPPSFSNLDATVTSTSNTLAAGDLDGDGDQDVAIASFSNSKVTWLEQQKPQEIEVSGNSTDITDGSTIPLLADDTDFGDINIGMSHTHTFTIKNTGEIDLTLTDGPTAVFITGSTDFIVSVQPTIDTLGEGETITFEVTFRPTSVGNITATISIANNDGNEDPFDFQIKGNGTCPANTIVYVDADAMGNKNGTSWTDAFNHLQDALHRAQTCTNTSEIWVADGTYYPDEGSGQTENDRNSSFELIKDVAIYGGFAGGETMLSQRNWQTNVAILSGDLMQNDGANFADNEDNSYHVVKAIAGSISNSTKIDGFTIQAGNADGTGDDDKGAGVFIDSASPSINNCIITHCYASFAGGGMAMNACSSLMDRLQFLENQSGTLGGGLYADGSPLVLIKNSKFKGNESNNGGAVLHLGDTEIGYEDCEFSGNRSSQGSAVHTGVAISVLTNCSFSGNNSVGSINACIYGTGGSNTRLRNSIVWGNSGSIWAPSGIVNVANTIIEGGHTGTNVLDIDPLFISEPDFNTAPTTPGDLQLQSCSPAIDIGDNSVNTSTEDLDGNPRVVNSIIDLGAYESQNNAVADPPAALCQSQTVQLDAMGNGSLAVALLDGGSLGCAPLTFSVGGETTLTFNCSDIGSNDVILTVSDNYGSTHTCSTSVTVEDKIAPSANCQAFTVQLDANGNGSLSANDIDNGSSDVCGNVSLSASPNNFNCSNIGSNTVILTVTDDNSNTATCNAQVTVEDVTMPQITCPGDISINLAEGQCDAIVNFSATATDACDASLIVTYSQNPGTSFSIGITTVMATAMDGNSNTSSCTFDIELIENVAPMACQDFHVQLDGTGAASITPEMVIPLSSPDITFNATGNLQSWTVPAGVTSVRIEAAGAQGGHADTQIGGKGAVVAGDFSVIPGATYQIIVGGQGGTGGGGGATFMAPGTDGYTDFAAENILLIAGGGGGASSNNNGGSANAFQHGAAGNGGGSGSGNNNIHAGGGASAENDGGGGRGGQKGGKAAIIGASGGSGNGGYGGGGGSDSEFFTRAGGGGGGATGGKGGSGSGVGSGGTSYNGGNHPANTPGANDGQGYLKIYFGYSLSGYAVSPNTFGCTEAGTIQTVTVTRTNCNTTSTCTAQVTVEDITPPTALCQPTTVQLNASGSSTLTPSNMDGGSSDECGGVVSFSASPTNFNCSKVGSNTVTLTVTDERGNKSTCTETVTVEDNVNPTANCKSATIQLDASGFSNLEANQVNNGSSDACGIASISASPNTFTCADVGTTNVTLTVTDNNGKANTCTATVTVEDNVLPTANCKPYTVQLNANGSGSLTASGVDNGSTDACGIASLSAAPNTFTCADVGQNNVALTVTDNNGKVNTCTATVTVEDNVLPTANCQPYTVQLNASGNGSLTANDIDNGSTDACGIASISASPNTFTCADVGNDVVTLTVTDMNGNENTCTATVTVEDNIAPLPTCKSSTVQLDASGNYTLLESDVLGGGNDNCGAFNFWYMAPTSVDCSDIGSPIAVTVHVFDANGNQSTCTAQIIAEDNVPPAANCKDLTVFLNTNGAANLTANSIDNGSADACGIASLAASPNSFSCTNVGANMVTLTATDGNGNMNTCTATVTVEDNVAPAANCKAHTVQLNASGNGSLAANDIDNGSVDACGIASLVASPNTFTCADVGPNTVTLTVTDNNGKVNTCTATVIVVDNTLPVANCQTQIIQVVLENNGQYTVNPNDLDDGSSDACGGLTFSASPSFFDCTDEGANTVTLTVTDVNGNSANCNVGFQVAGFLTITNVVSTPENCSGAGDGSIMVTATAGGGQIGYSIDNGVNFQFSNTFNNLTHGTYNIVVKVFGVPAVCVKTSTANVAGGATANVWYKDMDGDSYTDGISQMGCTQPTGYISAPLPGTDCNDYDASAFPGQIWYKDQDGDGYGNGIFLVACQRPTGYYTVIELTSTDGDCDDIDAEVHPDATEICNGTDDDCDGEVDEGTSGGLTYVGNVAFYTQAQVNAFSQCYSIIDGNLLISGAGIDSLNNLANLTEVTGNVNIQYTGLEDMGGMDSLSHVGGTLTIYFNSTLATLDGLDSLAGVGGSLFMYYNFQLSDCCAIYNLLNNGGVTATKVIYYNKVGCNSVLDITNNCSGGNNLIASGGNAGVFTTSFEPKDGIQKMAVYPNPTSNEVTVDLGRLVESGHLKIVDMQGGVVFQQKWQNGDQRSIIDLSLFRSGVYFVETMADGEVMTAKLVVQK